MGSWKAPQPLRVGTALFRPLSPLLLSALVLATPRPLQLGWLKSAGTGCQFLHLQQTRARPLGPERTLRELLPALPEVTALAPPPRWEAALCLLPGGAPWGSTVLPYRCQGGATEQVQEQTWQGALHSAAPNQAPLCAWPTVS